MKIKNILIGLVLLASVIHINAQTYEYTIPVASIPLTSGGSYECIGTYDAKSDGSITNPTTQSIWFRAPVGGQVVLSDTTPAPYTGKFKVLQRSNGQTVACGASPLTWHAGPLAEYRIDFYIPEGYTIINPTNVVQLSFQRPLYDYFIRWDQLPVTESYSSNDCGSYEGYVNITNPATGSIWWDIPESGMITAWDTSPASYAANLMLIRSDLLSTCANKFNTIRGRWDRRVKLIAVLPELYATIPGNTNGIGIRFPRTQIVGAEFTEFLTSNPSQAWFDIEAPDTNMVYSLLYSQEIGSNANWINHTNFRGSFALTNINVVAHMSTNRPHGFWRVVGTTNTPPAVGANVGTEDGLDTPIGFPPMLPGCTNDCGDITPPSP